jgi:hypothetical protein
VAPRLLQIISDEAAKSPRLEADGEAVAKLYGEGSHDAMIVLVRKGYLDERCPAGSIALSRAGEEAAILLA